MYIHTHCLNISYLTLLIFTDIFSLHKCRVFHFCAPPLELTSCDLAYHFRAGTRLRRCVHFPDTGLSGRTHMLEMCCSCCDGRVDRCSVIVFFLVNGSDVVLKLRGAGFT